MKLKRSPLAPRAFPKLPALAGVRLAPAVCDIRYRGRTDATVRKRIKPVLFSRSISAKACLILSLLIAAGPYLTSFFDWLWLLGAAQLSQYG